MVQTGISACPHAQIAEILVGVRLGARKYFILASLSINIDQNKH
jgi:hypothetical protein